MIPLNRSIKRMVLVVAVIGYAAVGSTLHASPGPEPLSDETAALVTGPHLSNRTASFTVLSLVALLMGSAAVAVLIRRMDAKRLGAQQRAAAQLTPGEVRTRLEGSPTDAMSPDRYDSACGEEADALDRLPLVG